MHICDFKNLSWNSPIHFTECLQGRWELIAPLHPCVFFHPHRIYSHVGSRDGSLVRAAALHRLQTGGSFRIILPSTPTSTAELMRWSRSSAR